MTINQRRLTNDKVDTQAASIFFLKSEVFFRSLSHVGNATNFICLYSSLSDRSKREVNCLDLTLSILQSVYLLAIKSING